MASENTYSDAPKPKAKPKAPADDPAKGKGKYQWGTGGKVHSISQKDHEQHVLAQKTLGTQDLTAPPTASQAITEANSAADLQYGPQVNAAQQLQQSVTPWFNNFLARVAGYAKAAQTQAAPVIAQAQGYQQGAATQAPPGLDPNSEAGQQAAQAAAGRGAIAQLGLDALNTNVGATQDYFGGQQTMAAQQLPQAQAAANQGLAFAKSQRGAKVQEFLTTARQNAQNYAIARGTLGLNAQKAADDTTLASGRDPLTNEPLPTKPPTGYGPGGPGLNKYGYTADQWDALSTAEKAKARETGGSSATTKTDTTPNKYGIPADQWARWSTSHRQRVIDAANKKGDKPTTDPKDIAKATGNVQNTITDIIGAWNGLAGQEKDDTSKPKDPKTKQYPGIPLTADDKRKVIAAKNPAYTPQMIHIALLRNAKPPKPLDKASIDYLHNLDPNIRIPKEWLPSDPGRYAGKGSGGNPPSRTGTGDVK